MSIIRLIFGEIWFRKTHFLLNLFAATLAVTLFVAGPTLVDGYHRESSRTLEKRREELAAESARYKDETRKIMLKMGFNLLILHQDTNMDDFWAEDYSAVDMPEDYVQRLANAKTLTLATHIVATLQQKIEWNDRKVLLTGYAKETAQPHKKKKKPMGHVVEPGHAYLGYRLGIGKKEGEKIEILGREFTIARILPEKGSKEDITIAVHLADAQSLLGKEGKVNQILALGCKCEGALLPQVRKQLAEVLPETKITEKGSIALARAEQRALVDEQNEVQLQKTAETHEEVEGTLRTLDAVITPVVVLASAIWIGLLALANVRERRAEIGILRAVGLRSVRVLGLFLGKASLIGVLGGGLGFLLGTALAILFGVQALEVGAESIRPSTTILLYALLGAPVVSMMACYLPALIALGQDPALVLREE